MVKIVEFVHLVEVEVDLMFDVIVLNWEKLLTHQCLLKKKEIGDDDDKVVTLVFVVTVFWLSLSVSLMLISYFTIGVWLL